MKKDVDSLLDQELTTPDMMLSKCSKNETSLNGKSKHQVSNVIEKKNEDDFPRDAGRHKLSLYKLYHWSKIKNTHSYLKNLWLDGGSLLKKETVCKKRQNKINSKRWESDKQIHRKCKTEMTSALNKVV